MRILTAIFLVFFTQQIFCQNQNLENQLPKETTYNASNVIDSIYGITLYEPLNFRIGGDSVRNDKGYACTGWKKDYYSSGELLHKGFYEEGQLKIYRNYYPDGSIERIFNVIDDFKSIQKIYYPDETLKSQIKYINGNPKKWEDYFPNGLLSYYEEYHRFGDYYIAQKSYYPSGQLKSIFELNDKKKLTYTKKDFHENGKIKTEGQSVYRKALMNYIKIGVWKYYTKEGKLAKKEEYLQGKIEKETNY